MKNLLLTFWSPAAKWPRLCTPIVNHLLIEVNINSREIWSSHMPYNGFPFVFNFNLANLKPRFTTAFYDATSPTDIRTEIPTIRPLKESAFSSKRSYHIIRETSYPVGVSQEYTIVEPSPYLCRFAFRVWRIKPLDIHFVILERWRHLNARVVSLPDLQQVHSFVVWWWSRWFWVDAFIGRLRLSRWPRQSLWLVPMIRSETKFFAPPCF